MKLKLYAIVLTAWTLFSVSQGTDAETEAQVCIPQWAYDEYDELRTDALNLAKVHDAKVIDDRCYVKDGKLYRHRHKSVVSWLEIDDAFDVTHCRVEDGKLKRKRSVKKCRRRSWYTEFATHGAAATGGCIACVALAPWCTGK